MSANRLSILPAMAAFALVTTQLTVSFAQNMATPPVTTAPNSFREPVTCQWQANVGGAQSGPYGQNTQGFNGGQFLRARNTTPHVLPRGTRLTWTVHYVRSGQQTVTTRTGSDAVPTLVAVGGEAGTSLHLVASVQGPMGSTPVTYAIQSCEIIAAYGRGR